MSESIKVLREFTLNYRKPGHRSIWSASQSLADFPLTGINKLGLGCLQTTLPRQKVNKSIMRAHTWKSNSKLPFSSLSMFLQAQERFSSPADRSLQSASWIFRDMLRGKQRKIWRLELQCQSHDSGMTSKSIPGFMSSLTPQWQIQQRPLMEQQCNDLNVQLTCSAHVSGYDRLVHFGSNNFY